MMNESANFNMPALLLAGPEKMIERAKANGLMVPLARHKVYVIGASPAGLNPQTWSALRTFWTLYFQEAGGQSSFHIRRNAALKENELQYQTRFHFRAAPPDHSCGS
jgi:hypothetical protein